MLTPRVEMTSTDMDECSSSESTGGSNAIAASPTVVLELSSGAASPLRAATPSRMGPSLTAGVAGTVG